MKKIYATLLFFALLLVASGQDIREKLDSLSKQFNFTYEVIKTDTFFSEKYLLKVEQAVNSENPDGNTFTQRVFLSHFDNDRPVVFITEGYAAKYAESPGYINELSELLQANQVCVEHRFFGESVPDSLDWEYLTLANAAADHHRVMEIIKKIYQGKIISTGISKGGQTTIFYKYFYPDDIDIAVPYVAPLNFSTEDKRVYHFLENVSSPECREKVFAFQKELLSNKSVYLPGFEKMAKEQKLHYRMGFEKAFELTVLEYSFAFFQWGRYSCDSIPWKGTTVEKMIGHLDKVAGLRWISDEGISNLQPFFYQAMREIGFYGYDISPFRQWVSFTENPTFEFTLPEGVKVEFDRELMYNIDCFIRHQAHHMLFIYGENDPWSSTAVQLNGNTGSFKIVKPDGSHLTRINNLDPDQKQKVLSILNSWLSD